MTRPDVTTSEAAVGPPSEPAADLTAVEPTAVDLTAVDLTAVDLTDVDLTDERVTIDLTGSAPTVELAARLELPVAVQEADRDDASRTLDPVVQVLIDRIRVKRAVARACGLSSENTPSDHPSGR